MGHYNPPMVSLVRHLRASESGLAWTTVRSIRSDGHRKQLSLENGDRLWVHRYALAGVGDAVRVEGGDSVSVRTRSGSASVTPAYRESDRWLIAPQVGLHFSVEEITTNEQLGAYHVLSQFHYRSEEGFGRRAVLLMTTQDARFPRALGFVELATPFLHLRSRSLLMDAPFSDPSAHVAWERWDLGTRQKLINIVVRISRIVIHPEVRGLGLTRPLIKHAAAFSSSRWQVGGWGPLFLEITADMLRFMPFTVGTEMRFAGESQGNLGRLNRDMAYLVKAGESQRITGKTVTGQVSHSVLDGKGRGILSRQRRDVNLIQARLAAGDGDLDSMIRAALDGEESAEVLLPLLRHPKPTYMMGLTPNAQAFVSSRASELKLTASRTSLPSVPEPLTGLSVNDLSVTYSLDTGVMSIPRAGEIRRAFGMTRAFDFGTGISHLSLHLLPATVCYVYGPSGSGKTTLLRLLQGMGPESANITGSVKLPPNAVVATADAPFPALLSLLLWGQRIWRPRSLLLTRPDSPNRGSIYQRSRS